MSPLKGCVHCGRPTDRFGLSCRACHEGEVAAPKEETGPQWETCPDPRQCSIRAVPGGGWACSGCSRKAEVRRLTRP